MLNIAICDDNALTCEELKNSVDRIMNPLNVGKYEISVFEQAAKLQKALEVTAFDIVLMDVELDQNQNGIQLARTINQVCPNARIIFVTSYSKYYLDVYDARHVYFVEKEKLDTLLPKAIQLAMDSMNCFEEDMLILKKYNSVQRIPQSEILYVEKELRKAFLHLSSGERVEVYMKYSDLLNALNPAHFAQVHRGFIVNLTYVDRVSGKEIYLKNQMNLPIGNSYKNELLKKLVVESK